MSTTPYKRLQDRCMAAGLPYKKSSAELTKLLDAAAVDEQDEEVDWSRPAKSTDSGGSAAAQDDGGGPGAASKLKHLNTVLPFFWSFRSGANIAMVVLVVLAIYCDLYARVERLPFHELLAAHVHPALGEPVPLFTVGGLGYLFLHLTAGSTFEYMHRRRISYPADVLKARDAQIWEELKVFADGFATQLAVGTVSHTLLEPYGLWWRYFDTHEYTWWWCAAHVVFYFVYMDYMSFATHYHILHGNNWCWLNLHKQHHQIKSPTAFAGVAVHPLEGVIQLAIPAALLPFCLPVHFWLQSGLMMLILLGPALGGHDGSEGNGGAGPYDFSKHYYHHTTWHRGRFGYKNYALFWSLWDRVYGTYVDSEEQYAKEMAGWKARKR